MAVAGAAVLGAGGCGRSAESRAAERAQDACIGSLAPVADGKTPSAAVLGRAVADAEAAARVEGRWSRLRARLRTARAQRGTAAFERAVDDLVRECDRVNDIVRRGGREEPGA